MGKRKKKNGLAGDIAEITASGIGLGVGGVVIGGMGAPAAPALSGITRAGELMPLVSTTMVGTRVIGMVRDLEPKKYKKRKKKKKSRRR